MCHSGKMCLADWVIFKMCPVAVIPATALYTGLANTSGKDGYRNLPIKFGQNRYINS